MILSGVAMKEVESLDILIETVKFIWICNSLSSVYDARNPCAQSLRLSPSAISQRRIVWSWGCQVPLCVCSVQSRTMPAVALADCSFMLWILAKMPRNDDDGRWPTHL